MSAIAACAALAVPSRTCVPRATCSAANRVLRSPSRTQLAPVSVTAAPTSHRRAPRTTVAATADSAPPEGYVFEESAEGAGLRLKVTVPASECRRAYDKTLNVIRKNATIEGFRKGSNIPEAILFEHMGGGKGQAAGKTEVYSYAAEEALKRAMRFAMQQVAERALDNSERIITPPTIIRDSYAPDQDLTFEVTVDLPPSLSWTRDYHELSVKATLPHDPQRAQELADRQLRVVQKSFSRLNVVADRGIEQGDVVVLDLDCLRDDSDSGEGEAEVVEEASRKRWRLDMEDAEAFLPEVVEGIKGMKPGDLREFPVTFPENWQVRSLAGQRVTCRITVHEVFKWALEELTDEMAPQIVEGCTTVEEVKSAILERQKEEMEEMNRRAVHQAILDALASSVKVEIPRSVLEEHAKGEYQSKLLDLQMRGVLPPDQMRRLTTPEMLAGFIKAQRKNLEDQIRASMALESIFEKEGLQVTEDEIEAELAQASQDFEEAKADYDAEKLKAQAGEYLRNAKAIQWLEDNVSIQVMGAGAAVGDIQAKEAASGDVEVKEAE